MANRMTRWLLISLAALGITAADAERPNVLFVIADDLNCALACYGDPVVKTPNLDRLAARGMVFERAYCQMAVCNPSRASMLTGLRPDTCGVDDLRKNFRKTAPGGGDLVTLPEHFKNAGYFTQNIGKLFHNMGDTQDRRSWSVDEQLHKGPHSADTVYRSTAKRGEKLTMKSPVTESPDLPDTAYWDGQITDKAVEALSSERFKEEPFFLAVGFWRPHLPFVAPKKYWDLYEPEEISAPTPADAPRDAPAIALHPSREIKGYGPKGRTKPFTPEEVQHFRHGYYAAISFLDAQVGRLLDALDASGHADDTIIVFTSDHGFHIGEQTLWGKTTNFELDARVPLIIAAPGHKGGRRTTALCELVDLYPTLAEMAGLGTNLSKMLEGVSLRPALKDPEARVKGFALTQHPQPFYGDRKNWRAIGYSIRTDRWRYTRWEAIGSREVVATELYDLGRDAVETRNQSKRKRWSVTERTLNQLLDDALRR